MSDGIQRATDSYTTTGPADQRWALVALVGALAALTIMVGVAGGAAGQVTAGRLAVGLFGSLLAGWLAMRRGWLTASGRLGAVLTGSLTLGLGGFAWGGLLVTFFVLSSLLSRLRASEAAGGEGKVAAKGARRDLGQVLANGGVGTLLAAGAWLWPSALWFAAFVGAMAAVTADTWSTEIGTRFGGAPRLITSGRPAPRGANGGVTVAGTLAGAAGGLTIGLAGAVFVLLNLAPDDGLGAWSRVALGLVGGLAGSLVDSLLGATVQAARSCPDCGVETEHRRHRCGASTHLLHGWNWLDNDRVNALAALAGAVTTLLLALAL